ncbi:transcription factor bHLH84-like [Hordeum vulgare]|nr:transcription factor bHLH84-like [Hordeum vulgare]
MDVSSNTTTTMSGGGGGGGGGKERDKGKGASVSFTEGEKVLAYHGPLLYEAKVRRRPFDQFAVPRFLWDTTHTNMAAKLRGTRRMPFDKFHRGKLCRNNGLPARVAVPTLRRWTIGVVCIVKARAGRGPASDPQNLYAKRRREKINDKLRVLQNLVPNGTKVDLSTMLEEAVLYVKFLQLQIKVSPNYMVALGLLSPRNSVCDRDVS